MADRIFEIEFRSVSTGDGAQQLLSDLDKLKQAAKIDQTTTAADPIAPIVKSAQELAQAAPAAGKSVKDMADMVNGAGASTSGSFSGLRTGIESLINTMRNGGPTIGTFISAMKSAASVGAAGAAAGVGAVVAATSAVAVALVAVTVKASKAISDFILEKEKLRDGVAEFNFNKLENAKLTFEKQIAAMDQMIERVKLYTELANSAVEAQAKLDQSERNMRMAKAEAESAKTVAASGNDPAVAAAEAAKLAAIKASLDAEERQSKASDEVTVSQRNHREAVDTLATITKRIADNEQTYERTQFGLGELAKKLTDNVGEQQRLSESTAAIDAEIAKLKEDERDSRRAQLLELMKRGAEMRDAAKSGLEKDRPAEMAAAESVNKTRMEQQAAENNLATALDQNTAGMTNAGLKYGEAAAANKAAMDALMAKLEEAKMRLGETRGASGTVASTQEQGAAYANVQAIEAQITALKQVQDNAARAISSMGQAFTDSARIVETKAQEATAVTNAAAQTAAQSSAVAGDAVKVAAEGFKEATAQGTGTMTEGIRTMGTTVGDAARGVAVEMQKLNVEVIGQFKAMQREVAAVKDIAVGARRQAEIATSQVAARE